MDAISDFFNGMYRIEPLVIENSISSYTQDEIEYRFLKDNSTPWYLTHETTQLGESIDSHSVLFHLLYSAKDGGKFSELYELVKPVMLEIIARANLPFNEFLQVRAVSQFPIATKRTHNFIHTDLPELDGEYFTAVYYINDTNVDGDTVIYNETAREILRHVVPSVYESFTEKKRVTPKRGSTTIFNGNQYHASTLPTKAVRAVLNFSWR